MAQISKSFLAVANNSVFNKSEWVPTGDAFTLAEICEATGMFDLKDVEGDEAEVTAAEFSDGSTSLRLTVPFKDGSSIELKAGKGIQNGFDEGDKVKLDLVYGQELKKAGQPSIVRYDVWASKEEKDAYLAERG